MLSNFNDQKTTLTIITQGIRQVPSRQTILSDKACQRLMQA